MPDLKERTAEAARIIKSNPEKDAAVRQFRLRWGMPEAEAQRLYEAALEPKASGSWLMRGLRSIGIGIFWHFFGQIAFAALLVIIGLTLAFLFPGVSDSVAWIATSVVAILCFLAAVLWAGISIKRKNPAAKRKSLVLPLVIASPLILIVLVSAVWVLGSDMPERSDLDWRADVPEKVNETNWIVSGELENNNAGWRVVNFEIDLVFYDGESSRMGNKKVELTGVTVGPGETQSYVRRVEVPDGAERYTLSGEWDWQKVE